jgi:hypothetical protein
LVLGGAVVIGAAVALALWPAPRPPEFVSTEHKFRARFGGAPAVTASEGPDTRTTLYSLESAGGERAVAVTEVPVPGDATPEGAALYLRSARDDRVRSAGGELVSDAPATLAGQYPGRKFQATVRWPLPGVMRVHIYLVGKRLYQVTVKGTQEYVNAPDATAFLDSFMVTE